ncbi:MAG: AMP-binding protein, partial [Actinomycetota bacterium]
MAADLTDHRDRQRPPPTSLGALLEPRRLVALGVDLDAMAVTDGREEFTWSEYGHAARTVARHLAAAGVRPGERVAIRLPKSAWSFVAVHGVLAAGAIVVPIDPLAPLEHAATTLHEADVAAVIVDHRVRATAELLGRVGPAAVLVPEGSSTWAAEHLTDRTWRRFDADEIHDPPDEADDRADGGDDPRDGTDDRADQVDEPGDGTDDAPAAGDVDGGSERPAGAGGDGSSEDDAYIVFTSGSTGVPKGIVHTHASALAYARAAVAEYGVGPGDRLLNIAGLHFDQSTFELYAGPLGGAAVIVVPDATLRFPASVVDLAADRGATVVYTVPHVLTQLVDRGGATAERLADLRLVKYGGSSFPPGDLRRLVDALGEVSVSNVYGPAEVNQCTVHAVTTPVGDDDVPIGGAWAA